MSHRHNSVEPTTQINLNSSNKKLRQDGSVQTIKRYGMKAEQSQTIGHYTYKKSDEIGDGYTSKVYRCINIQDHKQYAVKVIDMKNYNASSMPMLESEIQILRSVNHPNIIRFQNVYRTDEHCYLVTEYCPEGDLMEYSTRKGKLSEKQTIHIMKNIVEACKYLFKKGIIHRDIKPANIFKAGKTWKLADFGFAMHSNSEIRTRHNVGTPLYMPLESLIKNIYSPQSDIFAIGVIIFQLIVGVTPWQSKTEKQLLQKLKTIPFASLERFEISGHLKHLLDKMCQNDKDYRMKREEFNEIQLTNFVNIDNFTAINPEEKKRKRVETDKPRNNKIFITMNPNEKNHENNRMKTKKKGLKVYKTVGQSKERSSSKSFKKVTKQSFQKAFREQSHNQIYLIMVSKLNYCRFMSYMSLNIQSFPLSDFSKNKLNLLVSKHCVKLIKHLADNKINWFGFSSWKSFKSDNKYHIMFETLREYYSKYEQSYLQVIKNTELPVIKDINQQLPELNSNQQLTLTAYKKMLSYILPLVKECSHNTKFGCQQTKEEENAKIEALKSVYKYYELVDLNCKQYQNYDYFQENNHLEIIKSYPQKNNSRQDAEKIKDLVSFI